jgi:hypothetical protein
MSYIIHVAHAMLLAPNMLVYKYSTSSCFRTIIDGLLCTYVVRTVWVTCCTADSRGMYPPVSRTLRVQRLLHVDIVRWAVDSS